MKIWGRRASGKLMMVWLFDWTKSLQWPQLTLRFNGRQKEWKGTTNEKIYGPINVWLDEIDKFSVIYCARPEWWQYQDRYADSPFIFLFQSMVPTRSIEWEKNGWTGGFTPDWFPLFNAIFLYCLTICSILIHCRSFAYFWSTEVEIICSLRISFFWLGKKFFKNIY